MPKAIVSRRRFAGAVVLGAAALWSAPGAAAELSALANEVAAIGVQVGTLAKQYADPAALAGRRSFSERLSDGEILYLLGDFSRASLVLYEVVADPRHANEPLYPRALYFLAESLFQIGHDRSARRFFHELVTRRDSAHLPAAIGRLIEIADRTRQWQGLEEHIAVLEGRGELPPSIAYLRAKSLLRQGRPAEAQTALAAIPADHELGVRAAYLAAMARLQANDLDGAAAAFARVAEGEARSPNAERVRHLAAMARGRILLEQGKFGESLDAYQAVPRQSPEFEQALYEVTWTYVRAAEQAASDAERAAEFKKAQNALEILILGADDNPIQPEARLLLGNIRMRLGEMDQAAETFTEVVQRYQPARDELANVAAQAVSPDAYFAAVNRATGQGRGLLPPLAVTWARAEGRLSDALAVLDGLGESERSLAEAEAVGEKLLAVLESEQRIAYFPGLQQGMAQALELGNRLTTVTGALLTVERELLRDGMSDADRADLARVLTERERLAPAYARLPQRREEYEDRLQTARRQMMALQQQAFRLKYDVGSMRAQLNALRVWINQNQDQLPVGQRGDYLTRLEQQEREVGALEQLQAEIEAEIERERAKVSITSQAEAEEDALRARYQATLEEERAILDRAAGRLPAAERQALAQQSELVARYRAELETVVARLRGVVDDRSAALRADVFRERQALDEHRQAMARARAEAQQIIGEVARGSLVDVQGRFRDIVLRADVGLVDIAWSLKEQQTHEISRRVNEQRRELQILDDEFVEVLRED